MKKKISEPSKIEGGIKVLVEELRPPNRLKQDFFVDELCKF